MRTTLFSSLLVVLSCLLACASADRTGALIGSGLGAIIGYAIGEDTEATLIGAGLGAGAGYIIGNELDKQKARNHDFDETTPLTGSRWQVESVAPQPEPMFISKVVEFRERGILVTTTTEHGGLVTVAEERYRIVGGTLIINKPGYIINVRYEIQGDQMTVDAGRFTAVLVRLS